jgi:hypothetical protein
MKYIAYSQESGNIFNFYESSVEILEAPSGYFLLKVADELLPSIVDTHKVLDGELVPKIS